MTRGSRRASGVAAHQVATSTVRAMSTFIAFNATSDNNRLQLVRVEDPLDNVLAGFRSGDGWAEVTLGGRRTVVNSANVAYLVER